MKLFDFSAEMILAVLLLVAFGIAVAIHISPGSQSALGKIPIGENTNVSLSDPGVTAKQLLTFESMEFEGPAIEFTFRMVDYAVTFSEVVVSHKDKKNMNIVPVIDFQGRVYYNPEQMLSMTSGRASGKLEFGLQASMKVAGSAPLEASDMKGTLLFFQESPCLSRAFKNDDFQNDEGRSPAADAAYYGLDPDVELRENVLSSGRRALSHLSKVDLIIQCDEDFVAAKEFVAKQENVKILGN